MIEEAEKDISEGRFYTHEEAMKKAQETLQKYAKKTV